MAETRLSMLWERVDPAAALTSRFGFTDAHHAVGWLTDTLGEVWAVPVDRCDQLVISATNVLAWVTTADRPVIAKCSVDQGRFSRLADITSLTAWLDAEGVIPVAAPIATPDGRLHVERQGRSISLSPVIDGVLLDTARPANVEQAGRMLAALHETLATYPNRFGEPRATRGQQLVHNDFRSANVLHNGTAISAILDWDEATYCTRTADLAKAAVLLETRYHDWAPTTRETRHAFITAYAEHTPLTGAERNELDSGIGEILDHFGWG